MTGGSNVKKKLGFGFYSFVFIFMVVALAQYPLFIDKVLSSSVISNGDKAVIIGFQFFYMLNVAWMVRGYFISIIFSFLNKSKLISCYDVYYDKVAVAYGKKGRSNILLLLMLIIMLVYPSLIGLLALKEAVSVFIIMYWPLYVAIITTQYYVKPRLIFLEGKCIMLDIKKGWRLKPLSDFYIKDRDTSQKSVLIACLSGSEEDKGREVELWLAREDSQSIMASFELVEYYKKYIG